MRTKEERTRREIERRERQLTKPRGKWYFPYLVLIIALVYITDEIASQIGTLMKTEIANDMLSHFGQSSVGALEILSMISVPFLALGIVYKPLSDRFGRKPLLVLNTFGAGTADRVFVAQHTGVRRRRVRDPVFRAARHAGGLHHGGRAGQAPRQAVFRRQVRGDARRDGDPAAASDADAVDCAVAARLRHSGDRGRRDRVCGAAVCEGDGRFQPFTHQLPARRRCGKRHRGGGRDTAGAAFRLEA